VNVQRRWILSVIGKFVICVNVAVRRRCATAGKLTDRIDSTQANNGDAASEDFCTRDGLQLLGNDNYLTDELEDTLDLLLGTTTTN
jgi:hypothetical protein